MTCLTIDLDFTDMNNSKIARTGRVQNWMDNPESRLPVSCTVFVVEDSMEGPNGIEASWKSVSHALRYGAGVAVHLSNIRPRGSENGRGLVASGPCSFAKFYNVQNSELRRGGYYKNGAVVLHLDIDHPDIIEFCNLSRQEYNWVKRCINLDKEKWMRSSQDVKQEIINGIARGDLWLAKIRHDQQGQRIYANVCLEVFLRSRGTCLLEHINLGACTPEEISQAFCEGMTELINLHSKTGVENTGEYLSQEEDRQVGLGMLGLANLLSLEGVSYAEFADAIEYHLGYSQQSSVTPAALNIVRALRKGIEDAAEIARNANMDRAFAIAPTASCSYRYTDRAGYTTAPELAPPIGRVTDRDSSTFGVEQVNYGNVETAEEVGWRDYTRTVDGIMYMLSQTGLAHGYSFNSWSDICNYDELFIKQWLDSPQTSLYYSLQVMQHTQAKDDAMAALDETYDFTFSDLDTDDNDVQLEVDNFCSTCAE